MAVVHGIVTKHGGEIDVQSAQGEGTTVTITLPTSEACPAPEEHSEYVLPRSRGAGRTVLLAEDEPAVRAVVRRQLETEGFRVLEFEDAEALLDRFRENPAEADVLVLDKGLPRMDGEACLAAARELAPSLPAVLMSGLPFDAPQPPRTVRMSKPFGSSRLSHALHEVLDG